MEIKDMKGLSTNRESQRADFVSSLYKSLKRKTENAIVKHNKLSSLASVYLADGLDPQECVELLIIEANLSRNAATAYVNMAQSQQTNLIDGEEYGFQFEDIHGKIYSSNDLGITIQASSDEEAWGKAEEIVFAAQYIEPDKIISVDRIS